MEMELLRMNMSKKSEGGLFMDMNTFLAFGKDYVGWNFEKTRNPVYLHIKQTKKPIPKDRPLKKPTLLAIGVDGGYDNQELKYDKTYYIVIFPEYATFPFPTRQYLRRLSQQSSCYKAYNR